MIQTTSQPQHDALPDQATARQQEEEREAEEEQAQAEAQAEAAESVATPAPDAAQQALAQADRLAHQAAAQIIKLPLGAAYDRNAEFLQDVNPLFDAISQGGQADAINGVLDVASAALNKVLGRSDAQAKLLAEQVVDEATFGDSPSADAIRADFTLRASVMIGPCASNPELAQTMVPLWLESHLEPRLGALPQNAAGDDAVHAILGEQAETPPPADGGN